jgi:hypothetical protein
MVWRPNIVFYVTGDQAFQAVPEWCGFPEIWARMRRSRRGPRNSAAHYTPGRAQVNFSQHTSLMVA